MKASLNLAHHQLSDWLREIDFFKQELTILEKRLQEVAAKNTATETLAQVEHFQNQFILNREQADILHHDVNAEVEAVDKQIKASPEHMHQHYADGNESLQKRMKVFTNGITDLRFEFNRFLSRNF